MIKAKNAVLVDTTNLTKKQMEAKLIKLVKKVLTRNMEVYKKDLSSAHSKKFIELLNSETAKNKVEEGSIVNAEITNITEKFCWVYLEWNLRQWSRFQSLKI